MRSIGWDGEETCERAFNRERFRGVRDKVNEARKRAAKSFGKKLEKLKKKQGKSQGSKYRSSLVRLGRVVSASTPTVMSPIPDTFYT